jgi:PAS domain S-box-containing protein
LLPDFRVRQRDYLLEITRAITQELDIEKVLARILRISIEILAGQAGLIALREPDGWRVAASYGIPPAFLQHLDPLLAAVPEHPDPAEYELPEINRLLQGLTRAASLGLLVGVVLPLVARGQVVGVLFIFRNYSGGFSSNDTALLQTFADQAAIAVSNALLYTQVSQEKRRMDALLDSAADGILILRPGHGIERSNPTFARMLGIPIEVMVGRHHEDIIRWERVREGQTLEQAESGGWPLTPNASLYVEGDLSRPTGLPLPVGITYAPLVTPDGSLVNIIATVRDITRFREAEELKSTFISVVSHELRTPVALIKGYASTLRREDADWDMDVVRDSLAVIEEEADRLTEMIENLLDASRLQAGGMPLTMVDVQLDGVARRIAKRFEAQAGNHTLTVDFPAGFPVILGDENRLGQVFTNLIGNALKYSPAGGEVRIGGQVRPEQVIVCVSDQGPGIAAQDLPHVFDRFYRASEASKTTKGAGLGLYLSRAVIEAHGGRIWVDPKPGAGARICFSLPRELERGQFI